MAQNKKQIPELTALFPPDTAGRGMVTDIPVFRPDSKVKEVRQILFDHAREYDSVNYVYVVDENWALLGVASIKELLQARGQADLASMMITKLVTANPMDTVPHVASLALQHNLKMVPILDHKQRLVGAFSSNELLEILNKEFSDDLLRLSGVRVPPQHHTFDSLRIMRARLPWMLFGMCGGLITGAIVSFYRASIETTVLLAVFIPVIMSTGATSANQAAMIFIRNLLHADIKNRTQYVFNELKIGALLGLVQGAIIFAVISLFIGNIVLALAVSVSLFLTVLVGALIGVLTPMLLYRAKFDPALGAGPFLTVVKDVAAMTIYFSVATFLLSLLG